LKTVALLDLGGTVVDYYTREEFPGVLEEAIGEILNVLAQRGLLTVSAKEARKTADGERREEPDYKVRLFPGVGRLNTAEPSRESRLF